MPQQRAAVRILVARVRVGEMHAEVAQRERAKQRIGDRVQQHVGVRVSGETAVVRNGHAADDERTSGGERMHVEACADAHG